jgi:uncharacterized membrane protein
MKSRRYLSAGLDIGRQRGAIAIMAASMLTAVLLFTALAVDTGRLYLEKRNLQQQADIAALEAAQLYCSGFDSIATVEASIKAALLSSGFDADNAANSLTVGLGTLSSVSNMRVFSSASEFQSIQVTLTRTVPAALFAGGVFNDITLSATSVAERDLIATLSAGNSSLSMDSERSSVLNTLLGGLLGSAVNLSVASYEGLIEGTLTFGQLITELSAAGLIGAAGDLDDLSNLDLTLAQLITGLSDALTVNGGTAAAIAGVDEILNQAIASGASGETVDLNSILTVDDDYPSNSQANDSSFNPLHLINGSLMEINLGDTVNMSMNMDTSGIPLINELFGNTLSQTVSLVIQSVPTIAVGRFGYDTDGLPRTVAGAAAIDLLTSVHLDFGPGTSGILNALLGTLLTVEGDITIATTSTDTEAWLDQISQCPRLLSRDFDFAVKSSPGVATADLQGASAADPANLSVDLSLFGLGLVRTTVGVIGNLPMDNGADETIPFSVDLSQADALPTEEGTSSTSMSNAIGNGITTGSSSLFPSISATLLGSPITLSTADQSTLTNNLVLALAPILGGVAELALDPILDALGIAVGEVRVQILDVEEGRGKLML